MAFENIFTHGNLVDINVGMWTAERKLQPEDLGLEDKNISEAFTLGHKKLVPAEVIAEFKHLDYLARRTLERYSFSFEFGSARFVPKKRFVDFAAEIDKVVTEYATKADEFSANYSRYRLEMRQQFVAAAHEAYGRAKLLCGFTKTENEFVNEFIARVDEFYPDVSKIREKFHMEYTVFQVSLPDLSQASYEDLAEEHEKISMMQAAYQKSLSRKVEAFVDRITNEQREKAQEVLQRFLTGIKLEKRINESSMSMVKTMIEEYEKMDVVGDEGFLGLLKDFKKRLLDTYTAKDVRTNSALRKSIVDELTVLLGAASDKAVIAELANRYRRRINL